MLLLGSLDRLHGTEGQESEPPTAGQRRLGDCSLDNGRCPALLPGCPSAPSKASALQQPLSCLATSAERARGLARQDTGTWVSKEFLSRL